ncbi:MAG: hypothetical protein Q9162_003126 [Coniocarpon cinnabarinum]
MHIPPADDMSRTSPEHFTLRQTNVVTPQIEHAQSQQSVTATEDYQSARSSRPGSSGSNEDLIRPANNRFSTPPSSPHVAIRESGHRNSNDTDASTLRPRESSEHRRSQIRRKPVGSGSSQYTPMRMSQLEPDTSPPTPGMDDTPYIRFAIDQLTRDEEVRGSRRYPLPGASYVAPEAEPRTRYSAGESRPTAHQHQRSTQQQQQQQQQQQPRPRQTRYVDGSGSESRANPFEEPAAETYAKEVDMEHPNVKPVAASPHRQPRQEAFPPRIDSRQSYKPVAPPSPPSILVPYDHEIPPLKFVPATLKPLWLGVYLLLCLLMLTGLAFSGGWSGTHVGLDDYSSFGDGRYFVFQYLPTLCGAFMFLWLLQIQVAVQRISPFIAMSSMSAKSRTQGPLMKMQPTNFLLPDFSNFKAAQPVLGACRFIFWLQIFTVPLLTCLYNVYFYGDAQTGSWRWNTVQGIVWTLFALYLLLTAAIIALLIYFSNRRTGLRWDSRSIADLIAMLDRSNMTTDYINSEMFSTPKQFQERLGDRSDRLGYWRTSTRPNESFYGIGEEGAETRRYSVQAGRIREKPIERSSFPPDTPSTVVNGDEESGGSFHGVLRRYLPWYIRPSVVLLLALAAILLFLAFLIVSFVNRAVIHGFSPLTKISPTAQGFSATNFTYSFIPAIIAHFLFLGWLSIDYAFRRLQPYAAMAARDGHGAPAIKSLLLDYPARLPVSVGINAASNGDWRVLWFSTLSLVAAILPVLAGGCFWAQYYTRDQQVRVAVEPSGYYALCVFLALYAFSIPLVFIGLHKRRLPHACTSIAEQVSFLYQSNLVGEREWQHPLGSRVDMVTRLISARTDREHDYLSGSQGRFFFGKFVGRDGKTHLGIDRVGRGEKAESIPPLSAPAFRESSSRPSTPRAGERSRPSPPQIQKPSEIYMGLHRSAHPAGRNGGDSSPLRNQARPSDNI